MQVSLFKSPSLRGDVGMSGGPIMNRLGLIHDDAQKASSLGHPMKGREEPSFAFVVGRSMTYLLKRLFGPLNGKRQSFTPPHVRQRRLEGSDYLKASGTSMAAPVVSGVIGLQRQVANKLGIALSPADYRCLIKEASHIGVEGGERRVDAAAAVQAVIDLKNGPTPFTSCGLEDFWDHSLTLGDAQDHYVQVKNNEIAVLMKQSYADSKAIEVKIENQITRLVPRQFIVSYQTAIVSPQDVAHLEAEIQNSLSDLPYTIVVDQQLTSHSIVINIVDQLGKYLSAEDADFLAVGEQIQSLIGVAEISVNEVVSSVTPVGLRGLQENVNEDPLRPCQWSLDSFEKGGISHNDALEKARKVGVDPQKDDINLAVVDTGARSHPDVTITRLGDTLGGDGIDRPKDGFSHSLHVASIAAAISDNQLGMTGITKTGELITIKVLDDFGHGTSSSVIRGIKSAITCETPVDIINLSLGGSGKCSRAYQEVITEAIEAGAVVVVAAGNDAQDASSFFPANCANVISVGATDREGKRASFSNFGSQVDVYAPGVDILGAKLGFEPDPSKPPLEVAEKSPWDPSCPVSVPEEDWEKLITPVALAVGGLLVFSLAGGVGYCFCRSTRRAH